VLQGAKNYMRSVATSTHRVFGPGTYLVPITLVTEADARLVQFSDDLETAVSALVAKWASIVESRKVELGAFFDAKEFATESDVRAAYALDWTYVSFSAPEKLEAVDRVIMERANQKFQARCAEAYDEVVVELRSSALRVMSELAERLSPGPDGKAKTLRGTALRDLQSFVELLPKRDITGDDALSDAVARVAAFSQGLDVETLKKAPMVREQLQALAAASAASLAVLVETHRGRGITLE
jgi:hypothetical protein